VALVLVVVEAFIPSGGVIGLLAIGFLVVSLYLAFTTTSLGWLFVLITCVMIPVSFALWAYLWPRTPVAKYLFLKPPDPDEVSPSGGAHSLDHMIGQFGRSLTPMRPTGMVDFDGRRHEGMAEEGLIPANTMVRVVRTQGSRLVVRAAKVPQLDDMTL
jgi:membrane-bound ClpP family serine protease